MTVVAAKWTLAEYHRMIAAGVLDNRRVELIRGEIVEMPPEGEPHAYFVSESSEYLTRLLGERAKVRYGHPITLPNRSEPQPDIAVVQRLGKAYLDHHPYPEDIFWLIEYSDASLSKDLNLKSRVYAEVNIAEYWIANLKARSLIVFRDPQAGLYTACTSYTDGEITPLAFPNISISVGAIINRS